MVNFAKSVSKEFGPRGVRANAINPARSRRTSGSGPAAWPRRSRPSPSRC
ncbi:hypothetical protein OG738_31665 [Amycolatopsis sp. NBC_01488]|nr:hypothetical protein [Amycolatopsis sp. NBC_01488]